FYYARYDLPLARPRSAPPRTQGTHLADVRIRARSKFATHVDPDEYKAWLFRRSARSAGTDSPGPGSAAVSLNDAASPTGSGALSVHSDGDAASPPAPVPAP